MYFSFRLHKIITTVTVFLAAAVTVILSIIFNPVNASAVNPPKGVKVPIIMYHSILNEWSRQGKYVVSSKTFENDLVYLKDHGFTTIVVQDLINYVYQYIPLPEKPIIITFDDGYYNNYYYALPILKKYDCKMVMSPIGYYTDIFSKEDDSHPNYSHCTWDQIGEMAKSGLVEIQNHTYDLHSRKNGRVGTCKKSWESLENYAAVLSADVMKMQRELKEYSDVTPTAFTYPYGEVCDESKPIIKNLGFKASLTCQYKMNYITRDPESLYCMGRYLRSAGTSSEHYFKNIGA